MFDVGFWELVILFGLGLMVLGPERMPKVAAKVGRWAGQAKRMASNLTDQMRDEIEPFESSMRSMDKEMRKDFSAMRHDVGETGKSGGLLINKATHHLDLVNWFIWANPVKVFARGDRRF